MDVVGEYFHFAILILHSFSPASDVCNVYYLFTQVVSMIILCSVCNGGYSFSEGSQQQRPASTGTCSISFYSGMANFVASKKKQRTLQYVSHNDWFQTDVYSIYRMKPHATNNVGGNRHSSIPHTIIATYSYLVGRSVDW